MGVGCEYYTRWNVSNSDLFISKFPASAGTKLELGHLFQRLEVRAPDYLGA